MCVFEFSGGFSIQISINAYLQEMAMMHSIIQMHDSIMINECERIDDSVEVYLEIERVCAQSLSFANWHNKWNRRIVHEARVH